MINFQQLNALQLLVLACLLSSFQVQTLKIDRVILSSDANPNYIQFWPLAAQAWRQIVGVKPTLALIADATVEVDQTVGEVVRFEPIEGVQTSLHAQVIRLLLPALFEDDVSIISDIDMIPLSKDYFVNSIATIPENHFVAFRNKGYGEADHLNYPVCYNAAKGKVFKEIFNIGSFKDIGKIVKAWSDLGYGWHTDEILLRRYLDAWENNVRCTKLGHVVEKRVDRETSLEYNTESLRNGYYIDAHLLRPYKLHKKQIDDLVKLCGIK